jgi:hypothetical protein
VSSANSVARETLAVWPLVLVIAVRGGVTLLCRARTLTSRLARTDWGWRVTLHQERRLARRRELRLFYKAQKKSLDILLAGSDPLRVPETHDVFRQLGKAAFDADLIGAWDRTQRPYVFEVVGGQYRFRRCGTGSARIPG